MQLLSCHATVGRARLAELVPITCCCPRATMRSDVAPWYCTRMYSPHAGRAPGSQTQLTGPGGCRRRPTRPPEARSSCKVRVGSDVLGGGRAAGKKEKTESNNRAWETTYNGASTERAGPALSASPTGRAEDGKVLWYRQVGVRCDAVGGRSSRRLLLRCSRRGTTIGAGGFVDAGGRCLQIPGARRGSPSADQPEEGNGEAR